MKRILIVVVFLIMLTACSPSGNVSVPKTDVPYNTQESDFELVFSSYRQGNTVLYYPEIEGLKSLQQQDKLNEIILEDAKNVIALFGDDIVCITVDYEVVTKTNDLISIKYTGHGCTSSDCVKEETVEYISNISIPDGEIIK